MSKNTKQMIKIVETLSDLQHEMAEELLGISFVEMGNKFSKFPQEIQREFEKLWVDVENNNIISAKSKWFTDKVFRVITMFEDTESSFREVIVVWKKTLKNAIWDLTKSKNEKTKIEISITLAEMTNDEIKKFVNKHERLKYQYKKYKKNHDIKFLKNKSWWEEMVEIIEKLWKKDAKKNWKKSFVIEVDSKWIGSNYMI